MNFKTLFGKYVYILVTVSLLGTGGLFAYLTQEGIQIDCEMPVVCDGLTCEFMCDFYNSNVTSKYIYNYDDVKITFAPDIDKVDMYVKYYGKWVYTNFTMATRLGNIPDERKYVFVFPAKTTKHFKFVVTTNESKKVKVYVGDYKGQLISWEKKYETCYKTVPLYEEEIVTIQGYYNETNNTLVPDINITTQVLMGYDDVEYVCGIRKGIEVGGVYYANSHIKDNKLIVCDVDQGDRNWDEIPPRQYEYDKGVCREEIIK